MTRTAVVLWAGLLWFVASSVPPTTAQDLTADQIVKKVQEKYSQLKSYNFEHTVTVEAPANGDAGKSTKVASVKLISASENSAEAGDTTWAEMQAAGQVPFDFHKLRLEATGKRGTVLLAGDGARSWCYNSLAQEYIERDDRAALGPTAATMLAALHLAPLSKYADGSLRDAKLLADEELKIGKETVACYVVSGKIKPANSLQRVTGVLFLLQIHGFVEDQEFAFLPMESERPQLQLWVDKRNFVVWQSRFSESARKLSADNKEEPAPLKVTDRFTVAEIDAKLPAELWRFVPPKEAQKVDKFTGQESPPQRFVRQTRELTGGTSHYVPRGKLLQSKANTGDTASFFCLPGKQHRTHPAQKYPTGHEHYRFRSVWRPRHL